MLKRALAREDCDEKKIERFERCGIKSYRQLIQRSSWDVANVVDMSVMDLEVLFRKISSIFLLL
jgi:predicted metalloprotease